MLSSSRLQGILLMTGSMVFFALLDASAKHVMEHLPSFVAVFFRYALALLFSGVIVWRAGGIPLLKTRHPYLQVLRGAMLVGSTWFNFLAMHKLQLAQTSAILFTVPLWICALSVPLLGERVGVQRWTAVLIGFLGVLVIMRPGTSSFHPAMLFSVGSAVCGGIYNITTRKVGGHDRAETSLFYVGLVGTLGAAMPLPMTWQLPVGTEWLFLIAMGLFGSIGHLMVAQAHRLAPAAVLAPFNYTHIVWMILLGFLAFGDVPDAWTLGGAAIVIASGLFVFAREQKLGRQVETSAPAD